MANAEMHGLQATDRAENDFLIAEGVLTNDRHRGLGDAASTTGLRALELSSANRRLVEEIEQRGRAELLLASENRILELIATGAPLEKVLNTLCALMENLIPGTRCTVRVMGHELRGQAPGPGNGSSIRSAPLQALGDFGSSVGLHFGPPVSNGSIVVPKLSGRIGERGLARQGIAAYWVEPIIGASGEILGSLAVFRVSEGVPSSGDAAAAVAAVRLAGIAIERAHSDERARQQLDHLAHVARLATMGEMASGLAHELNQPLCAIVNFTEACAELVRQNTSAPEEIGRALNEVARQAERAGEVIRRLREFARGRTSQREALDINRIVNDVVGLTSLEARHHQVRFKLKLGQGIPRVPADPIQIQQVLVNLVRNGFDAMRDSEPGRRILTIHTSKRPGAVEAAVSDAGPGVPEEIRGRLFEPFFSTKCEGMGMGLSISRSIVEAHEGRIWMVPNRPRGASFRFTLPRQKGDNCDRSADRIRGR